MACVPDWERLSEALECVLPKPLCTRRCKLLPRFFGIGAALICGSICRGNSRATTRKRIRKLEIVKKRAHKLFEALTKLDKDDRTAILVQMIIAEGRREEDVSRSDFADRTARLNQKSDFLAKLGAIAPKKFWKVEGSGRPPNLVAYLVLQDTAAIFEWLAGTKAARGVHRITGSETGPFFRFASTLWPAVFGNSIAGLPAAMKNWAQWQSRYNERSALIANMALRHPTWGIFNS